MMMTVVVIEVVILVVVIVVLKVVVVLMMMMINARNEHAVQVNLHKLNKLLITCNIFREVILELRCAL
jgi:hypothetical protein